MAADDVWEQAQAIGVDLNEEALAALRTLPPEYVAEFLQGLSKKLQVGAVSNPNNYICAAIRRGYTPNDTYQAQKGDGKGCGKGAKGGGGGKTGYAPSPYAARPDYGGYHDHGPGGALADAIYATEMAGIPLSDEAHNALYNADPQHAIEILQHVAHKAGELRDPSNYICATLNRGYQSRSDKGFDKGKGKYGGKDGDPYGGGAFWGGKGCGFGPYGCGYDGGCAPAVPAYSGPPRRPKLIPDDASELEVKIVDINCEGLWGDQQFDIGTLLALRCLPLPQALEMLDSFANKARNMKGRGKGISNINNFVQAAVNKIIKGEPPGSGSAPHVVGCGGGPQVIIPAGAMRDMESLEEGSDEQVTKRARWD